MIAYFDCFSGISGDMTLGALIDLGVSAGWLEDHLKSSLDVHGFEINVETVFRGGIRGKKADVIVTDTTERDYRMIRKIIENSTLSDFAAKTSLAMFQKIAAAESAIHGCPEDEVHFHELGGVDAIVDMVGAAVCVEHLGIETIVSSRIALGSGSVTCSHGRLPVPVPATLAILSGIPVYGTNIGCELVTPTGAAIIATLASDFEPLPDMVINDVGYGAGSRDLPHQPNLLRIVRGKSPDNVSEHVEVIETNIDDMNPEVFGYLSEKLFETGALDVCFIPVYMKKSRPGTMLQVLCTRGNRAAISNLILTESSAIGVRYHSVRRQVLERRPVLVTTPYGKVSAKQVKTPDGRYRISPEFEACRKKALSENVPILEVYAAVFRSCDFQVLESEEMRGSKEGLDT